MPLRYTTTVGISKRCYTLTPNSILAHLVHVLDAYWITLTVSMLGMYKIIRAFQPLITIRKITSKLFTRKAVKFT